MIFCHAVQRISVRNQNLYCETGNFHGELFFTFEKGISTDKNFLRLDREFS